MSEPIHTTAGTPQTQTEPQTQATGTPQGQPGPQTQATGTPQGQPELQTNAGRQPNGQFAKGNPGGPGNPFARQTAALRKRLVDKVTGEELDAIADKLIALAKEGDVPAARLIFLYVIGKPMPPAEPDQLDMQEWEQLKSTAYRIHELPKALGPGLALPLKLARETRPAFTSDYTRMFAEGFLNHKPGQRTYPPIDPRAAAQNAADLEAMGIRVGPAPSAETAGNGRKQPSPNGGKRAQAPSANDGKRGAHGGNRTQPPSPNRVPQPSGNGQPVPAGS
jgi:hypothetical protein